jgi:hypothetical protein
MTFIAELHQTDEPNQNAPITTAAMILNWRAVCEARPCPCDRPLPCAKAQASLSQLTPPRRCRRLAQHPDHTR